MTQWPTKPFIYEINTWVWLDTLSRDYNWPVTLENVPDKILDELAGLGIDAIWLMGIWMRSPAARSSALKYSAQYKPALPDLNYDDIVGSPFAVGAYQVDENLGGRRGLAAFRHRLHERGLRLILDFVPNHVAIDHAWIRTHPDYLVLGTPKDLEKQSSNFFSARDATGRSIVVAHGRDPYFPGWIDTAQINVFNTGARHAMLATLLDIANQCDGVRCDMAMLLLNDVFSRTWYGYVGAPPETEFWSDIIPVVRAAYPEFCFIAEVYWNLESRLLELGFDLTYDKRLYDRIMETKTSEIIAHLKAPLRFQQHQVRFLENHDEPRVAETLGVHKSLPAAVLVATLPGAVLLHDGQFTGRRVKLPVQIGRQPYEPVNNELFSFYKRLLQETRDPIYQSGSWQLLSVDANGDNGSFHNLIAYGWHKGKNRRLIVVNLTEAQSQGKVNLAGWLDTASAAWKLTNTLATHDQRPVADKLTSSQLLVDLPGYHAHVFHVERG